MSHINFPPTDRLKVGAKVELKIAFFLRLKHTLFCLCYYKTPF